MTIHRLEEYGKDVMDADVFYKNSTILRGKINEKQLSEWWIAVFFCLGSSLAPSPRVASVGWINCILPTWLNTCAIVLQCIEIFVELNKEGRRLAYL